MRSKSKPLSAIPARKINTLSVDQSDRNGTRWSTANWRKADLARITDVGGLVPVNHLKTRSNPHLAFALWLEKTVKPETMEWIMSNERAFAMSFSAYRHLAGYQAYNISNNTNREAKPAESIYQ